jgi:hypothetical protein
MEIDFLIFYILADTLPTLQNSYFVPLITLQIILSVFNVECFAFCNNFKILILAYQLLLE